MHAGITHPYTSAQNLAPRSMVSKETLPRKQLRMCARACAQRVSRTGARARACLHASKHARTRSCKHAYACILLDSHISKRKAARKHACTPHECAQCRLHIKHARLHVQSHAQSRTRAHTNPRNPVRTPRAHFLVHARWLSSDAVTFARRYGHYISRHAGPYGFKQHARTRRHSHACIVRTTVYVCFRSMRMCKHITIPYVKRRHAYGY